MKSIMNKSRLRGLIAAACLLAFSGLAPAAESWGIGDVRYVYPLSSGGFVLSLATNPPACTNPNNPRYLYVIAGENGVTADGVKAMLASALTALAAGKQLQVAFEDSTSNCYVNRLVVVN